MHKVWSPYSFNHDFDPISIVPRHRRGVDASWMKQANSALQREFEDYDLQPGHTLIHLTPVVASELYSCNVNGDGFTKNACRNFHDTFLAAHKFLEHDNQDPQKGTGRPVKTAYNEKLARIELLVDIENAKNEQLLQKLASGKPADWSMACKIDWDECNYPGCGNRATSPKGPCDQPADVPSAGYCKHAKNMLGALLDDGHRVFVDNPHPHFFDISEVKTPAEVVARTMQYRKAASAATTMGGAELAARMGLDGPLFTRVSLPHEFGPKLAIAQKLAEIEKQIPAGQAQHILSIAPGVPRSTNKTRTQVKELVKKCASIDLVLKALRAQEIILDISDFVAITGDDPQLAKEASEYMPRLFNYLNARALLHDTASNGTFDAVCGLRVPTAIEKIASEAAPDLSVEKMHVRKRLITSDGVNIGSFTVQSKEASGPMESLVRQYAAYLLSELAVKMGSVNDVGSLLPLTALWRTVNYK